MIATVQQCPKCQAERQGGEDVCAKRGIIFAKYRRHSAQPAMPGTGPALTGAPWLFAAKHRFIDLDHTNDPLTFTGRLVVFLALVWWGKSFIVTPLETNATGESFFHLVNLPFHEAGHLIFMPFGRFMMFLGGSLSQILMPVVCLLTFLIKTRDPFGASVALWWTAENFMDVSPYINDARALDLMLLGGVTGKETDGHDWENILGMLGWLQYDHVLAHLAYNLGIALMLVSFAWGALLLLRHFRRLSP